jgi:hypothetical protein
MDEPLTFHVGEDYHWRHRLKIPYMPEMTLPMKSPPICKFGFFVEVHFSKLYADLLKRNEEVNSEKTICRDFMVKSSKLTYILIIPTIKNL